MLLHGNTVLLQDFICSGLIDRLSERHRVIAFDRPGFGYSERPRDRLWTAQAQAALIQQALAQIGVEQPVVLGHSWGTLVAMGMAVDFPTDVRGLVLISGYYYPTARLDVALTAPAALPLLGDAMRYTVSPLTGRVLLKRTVEAMFAPRPMPADFFDVMPREMILRPLQIRAEAEDAAFMIPAAARFRTEYAKFDMPVAIFAGAGDKIVDPKSHSTRLHQELPSSTLVVAPDSGHMVHYALAKEVVDAVNQMSAEEDARGAELQIANDDAHPDAVRLNVVAAAL
ncbi:alpha/beta fold hydrolase [Caballeronia terrestris]|uniref:alpha/beta fold hydrolase n=1 Tax=Caballeronia terrestris TaxID=1226301 RepID=UPI001F38A30F|nr:alpha/beta hydrolase [Caballeronia terrestris]